MRWLSAQFPASARSDSSCKGDARRLFLAYVRVVRIASDRRDLSKEGTMADDTPLLDTLAAMTLVSFETCDLDARELMLVRIAALAAADAPPGSYLANVGVASDAGITLEDVQGVLIAVAPIIGTARAVLAAGNIARALGFAVAALESELEAQLAADSS